MLGICERRSMIMGADSCISLATMVLGMGTIAYGVWLNLKPESLRPDTAIYRWLYWRWYAWGQEPEDKALTRKQIRVYGIVLVGIGLLLALAGAAAILA